MAGKPEQKIHPLKGTKEQREKAVAKIQADLTEGWRVIQVTDSVVICEKKPPKKGPSTLQATGGGVKGKKGTFDGGDF